MTQRSVFQSSGWKWRYSQVPIWNGTTDWPRPLTGEILCDEIAKHMSCVKKDDGDLLYDSPLDEVFFQ